MVSMTRDEHASLVALLQTRPSGLTWRAITDWVLEAGSAADVWSQATSGTLFETTEESAALSNARSDLDAWEADGIRFLSVLDADFPKRVRAIHEAPPFLTARGSVRPDEYAVSVVGSRAATAEGLGIARGICLALAEKNVTVIAGLALGIDTAAHTAALEAGGRTIAVIGTGIRQYYPPANRGLQDEIAQRGLVLSQFLPDAPPHRHSFLMRNAIMSGLGHATVIAEAGEKSGARAQARMAVGHGRPVILTDLVASRTQWGRDLVGKPRVYVASSVSEVLDALEKTERPESAADQLLRELSHS